MVAEMAIFCWISKGVFCTFQDLSNALNVYTARPENALLREVILVMPLPGNKDQSHLEHIHAGLLCTVPTA